MHKFVVEGTPFSESPTKEAKQLILREQRFKRKREEEELKRKEKADDDKKKHAMYALNVRY